MRNKITTTFFCLLLVGAAALSLALPDRYYSESEKRLLTQREELKVEEYGSGKFQSSLDQYLTDQFPGRDGWISLKTLADLAGGKREVNGVFFARDNYLIQGFDAIDASRFVSNTAQLKKLSDQMEALGLPCTVMPIPTAVQVLADKLPAFAVYSDQRQIISYMEEQGLPVLDVTATMAGHSGEYIYYRTDHHYTSLGAYYCYAAYRESRGLPVPALGDYQTETLSENFLGTSYNKVNYPFAKADAITAYYKSDCHAVSYNGGAKTADSIYERSYLEGRDQYGVFLNSNQAQTVIQGGGQSGNLLLIKDSFGNSLAQFPAEDYAEVHMVDLRFFRDSLTDYIRDNGITEVLVVYGIPNLTNDAALSIQ
jgi:hypothetical protein